MPPDAAAQYSFRRVSEADLPILPTWLAEPHIAEWWGDPGTELADIRDHINSVSVEPLIVELEGVPIGYLQRYDPHKEEDHPYRDQPFGTLGVDLSIGPAELVGIGHGSALLRQFVDGLFARGVPRVVIVPDPANARAVCAYEKAGFRAFGERTSVYGRALMMAIDNPHPAALLKAGLGASSASNRGMEVCPTRRPAS